MKQVATQLSKLSLEYRGLAARYGGEEFACVLPGLDSTEALQCGEKVRSAVESLAIEHAQSALSPVVTASIGVAVCLVDGQCTPENCLEAEDQALYRAKHLGRNCVQLA